MNWIDFIIVAVYILFFWGWVSFSRKIRIPRIIFWAVEVWGGFL